MVLFLAVADCGGLSAAARATGVSAPTLSRRMVELERQTGIRLFARGARGYTLTAAGRSLLEEAGDLRHLADRLGAFAGSGRRARVRVTAGHWTAQFLARHLNRIWSAEDTWVPEFVPTTVAMDIARREADIGIRNRRPEQSWLAGRRTGAVRYAPFAAAPGIEGWIAAPAEDAGSPSQRWIHDGHADRIVTTASDPRLALDLALAGVGQIVLPLFAASGQDGLVRTGPVIEALTHEEWLVCHHDARHDPPVRSALDAIAELLGDGALRASGTS